MPTLSKADAETCLAAPTKITSLAASNRTNALAALSLSALIWGFTPVAVRTLAKDLSPADLLVLRSLISGSLFAFVLTLQGGWRVALRDLPRFAACAATGIAGYNLGSNYGMQVTSASIAGLILGIEPLFITVLAALLLAEGLTLTAILGLASAGLGTALLLWDQTSGGISAAAGGIRGPLLLLAAAFGWSLYVVLMKPLFAIYGSMRTTALTSVIGMVPLLALGSHHTLDTATAMTAWQWTLLFYHSVLGTVFSIYLWNFGNKYISSASAAAFIYAVPLVSVVAGVALLGEPLTSSLILAAVLILAGVFIAQLRLR
jgi:drug/metabolite transporter (DMT)-like permease